MLLSILEEIRREIDRYCKNGRKWIRDILKGIREEKYWKRERKERKEEIGMERKRDIGRERKRKISEERERRKEEKYRKEREKGERKGERLEEIGRERYWRSARKTRKRK